MKLDFVEKHPFIQIGPNAELYPTIPVTLIGPRGLEVKTYALLDSGADVCLFHAKWARKIGLRLTDGLPGELGGIDRRRKTAYYLHPIRLVVGDASAPIACDVAFSRQTGEEIEDQLIGREVVFDQMRFAFRQSVSTIYIGKP